MIPLAGRSLEKKVATHSSILAWEIPRTEELGGTIAHGGCKRVGQDLVTKQQDMVTIANIYLASQALTVLNISHGLFHFILTMTLR